MTSAPTSRAISALRCSLPHGSVPHTRWVSRRHGACTETIGISWNSLRDLTASMSLLTSSMLTMTSTPSKPSRAAASKPLAVEPG